MSADAADTAKASRMASPQTTGKAPTEAKETRLLVKYGFDLARQLEIDKVLVISDLVTDRRTVDRHREKETIVWVTHDQSELEGGLRKGDHAVEIPRSPVGRMDQVTLALIIAVLNGFLADDESIVCLIGAAGSRRLDNLLIANPKRDFSWFSEHSIKKGVQIPVSNEFIRLMEIALKFAAEGREGKPVGTIFLLGDVKQLSRIARPLILNPCKGHPKKSRSIHDSGFVETMRELSALDGGFLVDRRGYVERAGVYFDAPVTKKVKVEKGLGSRHLAAAAATATSDSLAIVISESSGSVTVFSRGAQVMSLSPERGSSE